MEDLSHSQAIAVAARKSLIENGIVQSEEDIMNGKGTAALNDEIALRVACP